jgi:hypothetical protein
MLNDRSEERNLLRNSLGPGADCPSAEELARFVDGLDQGWARHIQSCAHCSAEARLLRDFQSGTLDEAEAEPVRQIAQRLRARSSEIGGAVPAAPRPLWWRGFWQVRWLSPALLAAAAVLIFFGVGLESRRSAPVLHLPSSPGDETLRSNAVEGLTPSGDIGQRPMELRWKAVRAAVRYRVRVMEVDGHELWSAETTDTQLELPNDVRLQILPQKTLVWEVRGVDASQRVVAESGNVRFRLLQNVYNR